MVPTKVAYLEMDHSPDLEFEFFLATKLHMTVTRMRDEMGQAEFTQWAIYYQRQAQQRELAEKAGEGK